MKAILFFCTLIFSAASVSATIEAICCAGDVPNPLAGYSLSCETDQSCTAAFFEPYYIENVLDYEGQSEDTAMYFYDGRDLIEREMWIGSRFKTDLSTILRVEWFGEGVYDAFLGINQVTIPVVNGLTDYVLLDMADFFGEVNITIFGQANVRNAFLGYTVSVFNPNISEVPIPAALYLFAPALLGFMGLRRKTKLS